MGYRVDGVEVIIECLSWKDRDWGRNRTCDFRNASIAGVVTYGCNPTKRDHEFESSPSWTLSAKQQQQNCKVKKKKWKH